MQMVLLNRYFLVSLFIEKTSKEMNHTFFSIGSRSLTEWSEKAWKNS